MIIVFQPITFAYIHLMCEVIICPLRFVWILLITRSAGHIGTMFWGLKVNFRPLEISTLLLSAVLLFVLFLYCRVPLSIIIILVAFFVLNSYNFMFSHKRLKKMIFRCTLCGEYKEYKDLVTLLLSWLQRSQSCHHNKRSLYYQVYSKGLFLFYKYVFLCWQGDIWAMSYSDTFKILWNVFCDNNVFIQQKTDSVSVR